MQNTLSCCDHTIDFICFTQNKDLTKKQQLISIVISISIAILFPALLTASVGFLGSFALGLACGAASYYAITTLFNKINDQQNTEDDIKLSNDLKATTEIHNPIASTPKPFYTAHIALRTDGGGFVGKYKDRLLKDELAGWTLQNGKEFPAESDELLLNFMIFYPSDNFKDVCHNSQPLMPASLFEGKNEGDSVNFCYNGQPISLIINQQAVARIQLSGLHEKKAITRSKNTFKEHFECTKKVVLDKIDQGDYGFNGSIFCTKINTFEGYTLKHQGVLYQFSKSGLQKAPSQTLKKLNSPNLYYKPQIHSKNNAFYFPVPGIGEHVDIILNDKFFCIYAISDKEEYFHSVQWKKYYNISRDEMETRLTKAKFVLENGVFSVFFDKV